MRNIFKSFLILSMGAIMFTSCEKDEFTEKDAMDELQHIDVALTVVDGSTYADVLEGVSVRLVSDSTTASKTTDSGGNVMFENMKIGSNLNVYVEHENYTKALYTVTTSTSSFRESQVSSTLRIYPLDGENMATVKGQMTIETDLTNREREVLAGQEVKVVNNSLSSGTESSFIGTTDENGHYEIKVPVNPQGKDVLRVSFPNMVEADQTLVVETEDGGYAVETVPATYYSNGYSASSFMSVPSPVLTIDAPVSNGSGFKLGTEVRGVLFSDYSEIDIIRGGTGYMEGDTILSMSPGINGRSAKVMVEIENGSVKDIWYSGSYWDDIEGYVSLHNDALYTSAPTLNLSVLGGTGAVLDIQFGGSYAVFIEDYGTNYVGVPVVSMEYKEYDNNQIVKKIDRWEDWFWSYFSSYVKNHQGSIYPDGNNGDTLTYFNGVVEAPVFHVATTTAEQAVFDALDIYIDSKGSIINAYLTNDGHGYDPENPPSVTVSSLAGYGSGAQIAVEVDVDGRVSDVIVQDGGEGYVYNVNDFDGDGMSSSYPIDFSMNSSFDIWDVSSGDVIVRNPYYGTGIKE